jgi:hypothetical protein
MLINIDKFKQPQTKPTQPHQNIQHVKNSSAIVIIVIYIPILGIVNNILPLAPTRSGGNPRSWGEIAKTLAQRLIPS